MRLSLAPFPVLALALSLSAAPTGAVQVQLLSSVPISRASDTAGGSSYAAALSADGRWVALSSEARNLVPGVVDENHRSDVFLHDRATGETILVSRSADDEERTADGPSGASSISADGRFLAFSSGASNLVPGQVDLSGRGFSQNGDFFFYDRVTGTTELISRKRDTRTEGTNRTIGHPVVSANGQWVVFASDSGELVANPGTGTIKIYLWERRTGKVRLISRTTASPQFDIRSTNPSISADGRFVTFLSNVPDLVQGLGEAVGPPNAFLFDRVTGRTVLIDHAASSATRRGNGYMSEDSPRITADGRFVVYSSSSDDLVAGQSQSGTEGPYNVFLYERLTGKNVLVSHAASSSTAAGDGASDLSIPNADGGSILFASNATNLVPGQTAVSNGPPGVFLYTRSTGRITLLSGAGGSAAATANASSKPVAISGDGGTMLFESLATDIVPGNVDTNNDDDLFVWDRRTGKAELVSHSADSVTTAAGGGTTIYGSMVALLSNDGKWIAFDSSSPDLAAGVRDTNGVWDVVLQARTGSRTLLTRRDPARPSATPNGASHVMGMSADGRFVVFTSTAADLLPGRRDRNNASDVFLADRATGALTLVSRSAAAPGNAAFGAASNPQISADGRFVIYESTALNVVPGQVDSANTKDVFLWDRTTGATVLVSRTAASPVAAAFGSNPVISADGSAVAFESFGRELIPGQTDENHAQDVFLWERDTGTTTLVSRAAGTASTTGNRQASPSSLSANGRFLVFASTATDLVAGVTDTNGFSNTFLFDRITGTTTLVSRMESSPTTLGSFSAVLSADGRFAAFVSIDRNLFLWDRTTGVARLVSHKAGSPEIPVWVFEYVGGISADGRFLAFNSQAADLVEGQQETDDDMDVFLYDRQTGKTIMVSRGTRDEDERVLQGSFGWWISMDGRFVVFLSTSADLIPGASGILNPNVFRYDRQTGAVTLVSHGLAGPSVPANNVCSGAAISANGAVVAFTSHATNLVARDFNRNEVDVLADVFVATWP